MLRLKWDCNYKERGLSENPNSIIEEVVVISYSKGFQLWYFGILS